MTPSASSLSERMRSAYATLGLPLNDLSGDHVVLSPIDGQPLGGVRYTDLARTERALSTAADAFRALRVIPAPKRGELIRRYGEALRQHKETLGTIITL